MRFEWDPHKADLNAKKHRVTFEEAQTAFFDEDGLLIADPDHSEDEESSSFWVPPRPPSSSSSVTVAEARTTPFA